MPFDPLSLGLGAITAIPKLIVGFSQMSKANKALAELSKQKYPEFTTSPEMLNAYNRAEAMSKYGYSPEERAQFDQQLARNEQSQRQSAIDMSGGNLSSAVGSVLQANQTDAINKFAAGGAELKRSNIRYADSLAEQLQRQKNLQTQNTIARRQMLEQAYGQAKSSALGNITGAFSSVAAIGAQSLLGAKTGLPGSEIVTDTNEIVKYDKNGNPTSAYLNSEEIAPESVPTDEQVMLNHPEIYGPQQ